MKTINFLDGISGCGLYFITSGQVQRAIGKQDPFKEITNPAERVKRIDELSKTIKNELNDSVTISIQRKVSPDAELELDRATQRELATDAKRNK